MNKYLQAEKELAELLGWRDIENHNGVLTGSNRGRPITYIPQWCHDSALVFELMCEHDVAAKPGPHPDIVYAHIHRPFPKQPVQEVEKIAAHPDKIMAMKYVIVKTIIAKLKAEKE